VPLPLLFYGWLGWRAGRLWLPKARTLIPVLLFCGWALLTLMWASNPYKGLELIGKIAMGPVAYLGVLTLVRSRREIRGILYLTIWTMVLVAGYGFLQYFEVIFLPKDQYGEADPSTTIGLTNFVVEYMMPFLLTAPILFVLERRRWVRALLLFAAGVIITYLVISRNRAAMVGLFMQILLLLVVCVVVVWRYRDRFGLSRQKVAAAALAVVLVLVGVFGGTVAGQRVVHRFASLFAPVAAEQQADTGETSAWARLGQRIAAGVQRDDATWFRVQTWRQALANMYPTQPIAGFGLANLEVEFPRFYTPWLERMTLNNNTRVVRAHNEYIQALIDLGLIGYLLFFFVLIQLIRTVWDAFVRSRGVRDLLLWMALSLGFIGVAVEMFFAFPLQVPSSSVYFFVAMALIEVYRRIADQPDDEGIPAHRFYELTLPQTAPAKRYGVVAVLVVGHMVSLYLTHFCWNALVGEVRNKEARVYKQYQRWDEAAALLSDAIDHYPYMEGYYYDRAVVYMQQDRLEAALSDLTRTADLVPNYAMGRRQIGQLAARMNRTELAVDEYKKTMEIFRSQREELAELIARTALRGNRPELAVPVLQEVVSEGVNNPKLLRMLADTASMSGQPERAIEAYETLRSQGTWDTDTRTFYSLALLGAGRIEDAYQELTDVVAEERSHGGAWMALGKTYAEMGRGAEAKDAFRRAVALEPRRRQRILNDRSLRELPELRAWIKTLQ